MAGGLAVFVRNEIRHLFKPVDNNNEDSVWIEFCKGEDNMNIFIGTCYISPSQNKNSQGSLETFFKEAKSLNEKGRVIMQGDFNARTACQPDYIKQDKMDDLFQISNVFQPLSRNSEDTKTCPRGVELLDFCKSFDYSLLNGRKTGDIFGKYTSFQWNGSRVVDYVLSDQNIFDQIITLLEILFLGFPTIVLYSLN